MKNTPGSDHPLRELLVRALDWESAHLGLDEVMSRFSAATYGRRVTGLPYTAWQLLEHMRLTQRDILNFCRDPSYEEPRWPDDYWPPEPAPESGSAWETSALSFKSDLAEMKQLVADPATDLHRAIPHGSGQTYLREALLIIDHNAYHLGQLVVLWRLLEYPA